MDAIIQLFNPSLVTAVVSWWALHALSVSRDRGKKKHDLKIQYLIEAYRSLESSSHSNLILEQAKVLENAIADVQLFGSKEQVELAQAFSKEFASTKTGSLDMLLLSLRNELRKELGLEAVSEITHLRIKL